MTLNPMIIRIRLDINLIKALATWLEEAALPILADKPISRIRGEIVVPKPKTKE